ncbi:hypothetical protein JCM8097_002827 [Rhodosporidiobolus ruineniae]
MSNSKQQEQSEPSQLTGQLKQLQGQAYSAVAALPGTDTAAWTSSAEALHQAGEREVEEAQARQKSEGEWERVGGKVQSAYGMMVGDQDAQNEGNLKAEKGEWRASVLGEGEVPSVSGERVKGKVESAIAMVTGDQAKQNEGNLRAEKAEWTQG